MFAVLLDDHSCEEVWVNNAEIKDGYVFFYNNEGKLEYGFNLDKILGFVSFDETSDSL